MLWFQKDSLDRVGFGTYGRGSRVLNQKVTFGVLKEVGVISLGLSPKKYHFLAASLIDLSSLYNSPGFFKDQLVNFFI